MPVKMPAGGSDFSLTCTHVHVMSPFFFFSHLLLSTSPPSATVLPPRFLKFTLFVWVQPRRPPAERAEGGAAGRSHQYFNTPPKPSLRGGRWAALSLLRERGSTGNRLGLEPRRWDREDAKESVKDGEDAGRKGEMSKCWNWADADRCDGVLWKTNGISEPICFPASHLSMDSIYPSLF